MSDQSQILADFAAIVNDETGIPVADITPEKTFVEDLDVDSLSMMTIVVEAQEKFGVEIPDEALTELKTVGDAITFIVAARSGATVQA
ncbi:acyl carrier protein [Spongisporangium articulatum]|uniref:Acyl carrier protein n=1 Tax=Spongisporangium articulatum TaxID=3362603 RepID=A0ABW8AMF8_9ACTN